MIKQYYVEHKVAIFQSVKVLGTLWLVYFILTSLMTVQQGYWVMGLTILLAATLQMFIAIKKFNQKVWLQYLLLSSVFVLLTGVVYVIEERYFTHVLSDMVTFGVDVIWDLFSGVFKIIAALLILLYIAISVGVIMLVFVVLMVLTNVYASTKLFPYLPK
jgi:hypothetical protein